jgi:hypothetical protein
LKPKTVVVVVARRDLTHLCCTAFIFGTAGRMLRLHKVSEEE